MTARRALVDRDKLNSTSRSEVARDCVRIFDRIQTWPKESQVLALAAAFILACDACRLPPQDAFQVVKNQMHDSLTASGMAPQFRAVKYHLETEVFA